MKCLVIVCMLVTSVFLNIQEQNRQISHNDKGVLYVEYLEYIYIINKYVDLDKPL